MNKDSIQVFMNNSKIIPTRLTNSYIKNHQLESLVIKIEKYTLFLPSKCKLSLRIRAISDNITHIPICICGQPVKSDYVFMSTCGDRSCWHKTSSITNKKNNDGIHSFFLPNTRKKALRHAQTSEAKHKRKTTSLERFGKDNINNRKKAQETIARKNNNGEYCTLSKKAFDVLSNKQKLSIFAEEHNTPKRMAEELEVNITTIHNYLNKYNLQKYFYRKDSSGENEVATFISNFYHGEIVLNTRKLLKNKKQEIDIYLPEMNLAFEYNGLYWHSESQKKDRKYHLKKTEELAKQGITLIHVWDGDWQTKQEIWKSRILSLLGKDERIYGRKCKFSEISKIEKKTFLNDNHLQGNDRSKYQYGLWYENNLIAVMTFQVIQNEYVLSRFASAKTIVGGFSKLLVNAHKLLKMSKIISFVNLTYSDGKVYKKNNFTEISRNAPTYWYTSNYIDIIHKRGFQLSKLESKLEIFDPKLTEWQNMLVNGYDRVWDCGTVKYEYDFTKSTKT